jgi:CheY-like chemotaxis protein
MTDPVVLVIEDDPVVRAVTYKQITQLGYRCLMANSAEEALSNDLLNVGLIFMDIGLPGMDGICATHKIRDMEHQAAAKHVPIIALTAHSTKEACLTAGMDDFLQKPAMLSDIEQVLDRWLPKAN